MYRARSYISLKPRLDGLQDRTTIGVLAQTQDLEKHRLLEWTEHVCHNGYIVGIIQTLSTLESGQPQNTRCPLLSNASATNFSACSAPFRERRGPMAFIKSYLSLVP